MTGATGSLPPTAADTGPGFDDPDNEYAHVLSDRYELLGEIARGGMGVVLRCRDRHLRRDLAVKVLLERHAGRPDIVRRFLEEAQIAGQLQHPGVVAIHELGTLADGRPFFAMKLIKGRTLAELLAERPDPGHQQPHFLGIFLQICQTVAYAHSKQVIHRDLKPANVMVGAFGEVQVMDWGLAKVLAEGPVNPASQKRQNPELAVSVVETVRAESDSATQAGSVLGTFAYMPPEQARGEAERIDQRSDVFGLGAILCEILIGQPPYTGSGEEIKAQAQVGHLAPVQTRLQELGAERELVALARTCLQPNPDDRPRDAGVVTTELAAYLAAVQDRLRQAELDRAATIARGVEERKRRRWQLGLAGMLALVVFIAGGATFWYQRDRQARRLTIERDAVAALREATTLEAQGETVMDDPERWRAALTMACSAQKRAEVLVAGGPADDALREQVERVRQQLADADRDCLMVEELDRIRLQQAEQKDGRFDNLSTLPRYAAAFQAYGIDVLALEPTAAAESLRQRRRLQATLLAALAHWATFAPKPTDRQRLSAILEAVEPEGQAFRQRCRAALARKDAAALTELTDAADLAGLPPAAVTNLSRGLRYLKAYAAAARLLQRAQKLHPNDFWLNHDLGMTLKEIKQPEAAVRYLTAALALRSRSSGVYLNLGTVLRDKGDLEEAIHCYRTAIDLDPKYVQAHINLGNALFDRRDLDGAIHSYRTAIDIKPTNVMAHTNLGTVLMHKSDLEGAIHCYRAAIELDPKYAPAHHNLGKALKNKKELDAAIRCYRTAIDIDPKNPAVHNSLGIALREQHDSESAIQSFRAAIAIDSRFAPAHHNLGDALKAKGDLNGAIRSYTAVIDLNPKDVGAHVNLGVALKDKKDLDGAIRCFRSAIDLDPKSIDAHYDLGNALHDKNDLEGAIRSYRTTIQLEPKHVKSHTNLGIVLREKGDLEGAMDCFRAAIEINPKFAAAHHNLGKALKDKNDLDAAIRSYRTALDLDPKNAPAYNSLGIALHDKKDLEGAVRCYRTAIDLDPKFAQAHYNLGIVLQKNGDLDAAVRCYRAAIAIDAKYPEALCNLGNVLRQQGQFREALETLERGHGLGSQRSGWKYPSAQWVEQAKDLLDLDKKLAAILAGHAQAADAEESLDLANLCLVYKKRYAAAATFYAAAFADQPSLADDLEHQNRYNAARAAVLVSLGLGQDDGKLDDAKRARLRAQALAWLRADLDAWGKRSASSTPQDLTLMQRRLGDWRQNADLAGVRAPDALAKLPEAEQIAWQKLWTDVGTLVTKTRHK
jgi:serine/threonine-protein kinase